ncbi:MAG: PEP/pyruvate-binding domain-containing protein [Microthrixaceae bacterium]
MPLVYAFDHRHRRSPKDLKDILGGKGANLAEMASVLRLPVPPGFTITTEACREYLLSGWPASLDAEVDRHLADLERSAGRTLGDPVDPLLVSVRSGARFSMPGMMDTVLNLGLNDRSVSGLAAVSGDVAFAYNSYARLIATFAEIVHGADADAFGRVWADARIRAGVGPDAHLGPDAAAGLCARFAEVFEHENGTPFPQDPRLQLDRAIRAVFSSWGAPRATAYREHEHIDHGLGTAVNVQAMVFGNRDERSGTGVAFSRDPATGRDRPYGDFLVNAQGEDVVAGVRITEPLSAMAERFGSIHEELLAHMRTLEVHFRDMVDVEFTIEQDRLHLLQVRVGKRTGAAALRMAVDMTADPDIALSRAEAVGRVSADHLDQVLHPRLARVTARPRRTPTWCC